MALKERDVIDQISADEYGNVSVRTRTDILRDGEVVSYTYHRRVIGPNDDLKDVDPRVAAIAKAARKDALPIPDEG
jgi:hypothetical protein